MRPTIAPFALAKKVREQIDCTQTKQFKDEGASPAAQDCRVVSATPFGSQRSAKMMGL